MLPASHQPVFLNEMQPKKNAVDVSRTRAPTCMIGHEFTTKRMRCDRRAELRSVSEPIEVWLVSKPKLDIQQAGTEAPATFTGSPEVARRLEPMLEGVVAPSRAATPAEQPLPQKEPCTPINIKTEDGSLFNTGKSRCLGCCNHGKARVWKGCKVGWKRKPWHLPSFAGSRGILLLL